jgi:hypothetical protein
MIAIYATRTVAVRVIRSHAARVMSLITANAAMKADAASTEAEAAAVEAAAASHEAATTSVEAAASYKGAAASTSAVAASSASLSGRHGADRSKCQCARYEHALE